MYGFLLRFLPKKAAIAVVLLWWLFLLIAVYALSIGPEGDFRYLRI